MKAFKPFASLLTGGLLAIALAQSCSSPTPEASTETVKKDSMTADDLLARGTYIVSTSGCNDCHSPKIMTPMGPVPDSSRRLSGHPADSKLPAIPKGMPAPGGWVLFAPDLTAVAGPWGISYSANLTPDSATGLGAWTADQFIATMRTGKHLGQPGGRPILPPMPWQELKNMTDHDLKAVFTYLQSLPAIHNQVPAPTPPTEIGK